MGAVLEPTVTMGGWSVEVRRESAYLNGPTLVDREKRSFAIPDTEVGHVVSALDQIMAHDAYADWLRYWDAATEPWRVHVVPGWIELSGPAQYYGDGNAPWLRGSVELPYEQLEPLRTVLCAHCERTEGRTP